MDRIECSDRLDWKGTAGAEKHVIGDGDEVASIDEGLEPARHSTLLTHRQPANTARSENCSASLGDR
jgi:hypothetical protein